MADIDVIWYQKRLTYFADGKIEPKLKHARTNSQARNINILSYLVVHVATGIFININSKRHN